MNLRRELRTKLQEVLNRYPIRYPDCAELADELADAALSVSGIAKRQTDDAPTIYDAIAAANRKVDAILDMANAPGIKAEARRAAIQSYLGERLHVNTETKAWREFAKYADGRAQANGETVTVFIAWLLGQDKFNIQYWPPRRMQEMWPQAFMKAESVSLEDSGWK